MKKAIANIRDFFWRLRNLYSYTTAGFSSNNCRLMLDGEIINLENVNIEISMHLFFDTNEKAIIVTAESEEYAKNKEV